MSKNFVYLFFALTFLNGCQRQIKTPEVTLVAVADDSEELSDDLVSTSNKYTGKYDFIATNKQTELTYYSQYQTEVVTDTANNRTEGYEGRVEITNLTAKGFDLYVDVILYSHCSGGINGKAVFNAINRANIIDTENDCLLTFTFLKDTLIVNQTNCTEYHGAACQFEDVYVLNIAAN